MEDVQAVHPLLQAIEDKRIKDVQRILDKTPMAQLEPHLSVAFTRALTDTTEVGLQLIDALLRAKPSLINAPLMDGSFPLINAVIFNHLPTVKTLIEHGANFSVTNNEGLTPEKLAEELDNHQIKNYLAGLNQEYDIPTILTAHQKSSFFSRKESEQKLATCLRRLLHATAYDHPLSLGTPEQTQQCLKIINDSSELLKLFTEENSEGFTLSYFLRDAVFANQKHCPKLAQLLLAFDKEINLVVAAIEKDPLKALQLLKRGASPSGVHVTKIMDYTPDVWYHPRGAWFTRDMFSLLLNILRKKLHFSGNVLPHGGSLIHYAQTPDIMGILIKSGMDINEHDNRGDTALHLAAEKDNFELVKFLVKNGANIHSKNPYTYEGDIPLRRTRNQDVRDYLGTTEKLKIELCIAIIRNEIEKVETLIVKHGRHLLNFNTNQYPFSEAREDNRQTPLYVAPSEEMVRVLVKHGCSVHHVDNKDETPLHFAITQQKPNLGVIKALIESGADITVMKNTPVLLFDQAQSSLENSNYYDPTIPAVRAYLCNLEKSLTDHFFSLIEKGDLAAIKQILTPQNARFYLYLTPLNLRGYSAIEWAIIYGKHEITDYFISFGKAQKIFPEDYRYVNEHFLVRAFKDEHYPAVAFLNTQNPATPEIIRDLYLFAVTDQESTRALRKLKFLSTHFKVELNTLIDQNGNTLLHCANSLEVIDYLVERNANVFARNTQGLTPLDILAQKERNTEAAFPRLAEHVEIRMREMREYIERGEEEHFKKHFCEGMDVIELYATAINYQQHMIALFLAPFIEKKGGFSSRNVFGKTVLHYLRCATDVLELPLFQDMVANNKADRDGCIALHDTARTDAIHVVHAIVKSAPAQIWHKNHAGQTPFDCATGESKAFLGRMMQSCDEYFAHIAAGRVEEIKNFRERELQACKFRNPEGLSDIQYALHQRQFDCIDYFFMNGTLETPTAEELSYWRDFFLHRCNSESPEQITLHLVIFRQCFGEEIFDALLATRDTQQRSLYYMLIQHLPNFKHSALVEKFEAKVNSAENLTEILRAMSVKDFESVNSLVKLGFDCHEITLSKSHVFVSEKTIKQYRQLFNIISLVLEHGASVGAETWSRFIAFLRFSDSEGIQESDVLKLVALLWEKKGLNVFNPSDEITYVGGQILLLDAVSANYLHVAAYLTENGVKPPPNLFAHTTTPEAVEFVLSLGLAIDTRNADKDTALYNAAAEGNLVTVKLLLKYGAFFSNAFPDGKLPPQTPADVREYLERYKAELDELFDTRMAVMRGHIERGEIDAFKARFSDGLDYIQLYAVALDHNQKAIAAFIESKQEVDGRNVHGKTIAHFIRTSEGLERLLVRYHKKDCDTNWTVTDNDGRIPLHDAAEANALEVVQSLIKLMPNAIWKEDKQKRKPSAGQPNEAKQYIEKCESVANQFFHYVKEGSLETLQSILVKRPGGIWVLKEGDMRLDYLVSSEGRTPFEYAVHHNQFTCADFLSFTSEASFRNSKNPSYWQDFLMELDHIERIQHYLRLLSELNPVNFEFLLAYFYYYLIRRYPSLRGFEALREFEAKVNTEENTALAKKYIAEHRPEDLLQLVKSGFDCRDKDLFSSINFRAGNEVSHANEVFSMKDRLRAATDVGNFRNLISIEILLSHDVPLPAALVEPFKLLCLESGASTEHIMKCLRALNEKHGWNLADQNNVELQTWLAKLLTKAISNKAIANNDIPFAKYLIQQGVRVPHDLIHAATTPETIAFVATLAGVEVNALDEEGHTALHREAMKGNLENVQALIEAGASIYIDCEEILRNQETDKKTKGVRLYLLSVKENHHKLFYCISKRTVEVFTQLLDESFTTLKTTFAHAPLVCHPLYYAVKKNRIKILRLLLQRGISVSSEILHCATSVQAAQLLMEKGANPHEYSSNGRSILHTAKSPELAAFYLGQGINLFAHDNDGKTPYDTVEDAETKAYLKSQMDEVLEKFFRWVQAGDVDNVAAQLQRGIDLTWKNADNKNALEWAILYLPADHEIISRLFSAGATVTEPANFTTELIQTQSEENCLKQLTLIFNCFNEYTCLDQTTVPARTFASHHLVHALEKNYISVMRFLLERNPAACKDKALLTKVLKTAVVKNNLEAVKLLVESDAVTTEMIRELFEMLGEKANENPCMIYLKTHFLAHVSFSKAVKNGDTKEIDRFITLGIDPALPSLNILHEALCSQPKQFGVLLHLLQRGVVFSFEQQCDMWMASIMQDNAECEAILKQLNVTVRDVLRYQAEKNHTLPQHAILMLNLKMVRTIEALFKAVAHNDHVRTQEILEHYPWLVTVKNNAGHSIVQVAIETRHGNEHFLVLRYLEQNENVWPFISPEDKTALFFMYLEQCNIPKMADMIKKGFDPNVCDATGNTPIHNTTSESAIEFLARNGCDINALNRAGWTALHGAVWRRDFRTAQTLIRCDANPHIPCPVERKKTYFMHDLIKHFFTSSEPQPELPEKEQRRLQTEKNTQRQHLEYGYHPEQNPPLRFLLSKDSPIYGQPSAPSLHDLLHANETEEVSAPTVEELRR